MRVSLLGSGGSAGVPEVGCHCDVCTSNDPKNQRTRASLLIEHGDHRILIDTSPDLRQQALKARLERVDAVLYTHEHADHTAGIDDIRAFNKLANKPIDIYGTQNTLDVLQSRFGYAFQERPEVWYRPCLVPHMLPDAPIHDFELFGAKITAFEQLHGRVKSLGFRIGNFAYSTDVDILPESAFTALGGVEIWMVDCLRYTHSYTHSNLENTLKWIQRVNPKKAVLIHMAHELDYHTLKSELPDGIIPGFDGISFQIEH